MKQYCRYCNNLCVGDVPYCSVRDQVIPETRTKHANKCNDFEFNKIDAYGETKGYKPRKPRKKIEGQMKLEGLNG